MEVVVAIVLLGGLALLASRFGYDSRETHRSQEEILARYGMRWEVAPLRLVGTRFHQHYQASRAKTGRVRWVRVRLAAAVVWLANWLDPTAVASAS